MPRVVGQLGPLDPELPPQRQELAAALRIAFGKLGGLSVRTYAEMNAHKPSSVSRYLSGQVLPSEEFIEDLVDAAERHTARSLQDELDRLRELLHAAQDMSSGTWSYKKRLVARARRAQEQTATALQHNHELQTENRLLRQQLDEALRSVVDVEALISARERIAALELECTALRAQIAQPAREIGPQRGHWDSYARTLATRGWTPDSILSLESTTNAIVERLSASSAPSSGRVKGIVTMMPQTGKTTNVIATVAKAADIGCRLIIVVAGTTNVVRRQLQERLDHDLPPVPGAADIVRLTDQVDDYRRLHANLRQLEFENEDDLNAAPVRLLVIKRNVAVLRKLLKDLNTLGGTLADVPALVIDTDAAAAGFAADKLVSDLVDMLPRADYVAFSDQPALMSPLRLPGAPLAPTDFLITPPRPEGYLGAQDLFGADTLSATSATPARIRRTRPGAEGLRVALDMFVLTGAVKSYREVRTGVQFAQHLLMVGTIAMSLEKRLSLLGDLRQLWNESRYDGQAGQERLRDLFTRDVLPTSHFFDTAHPVPDSFEELLPHVMKVVDRTSAPQALTLDDVLPEPLWSTIVVSDKTQLVPSDGLTVLYVHNPSRSHIEPVLRLTGKLFGFRIGYADLVRLYLPMEADPAKTDIYPALAESWRAEVELLDEWQRYATDPASHDEGPRRR